MRRIGARTALRGAVRAGRAWSREATAPLRRRAGLDAGAVTAEVQSSRARLERLLTDNLLPFWVPRVVDPAGGFRCHHDRQGRWRGPGPQRTIAQARTTWFFAALSRSRWGAPEHLELSAHGAAALCDRLWDRDAGGFVYETDAAWRPVHAHKDVYTQTIGLRALSEHALATGDARAEELASELFALLEEHAHGQGGRGYLGVLDRGWTRPPSPITAGHHRDPAVRSINYHLHLADAFDTYRRLAPSDLVTRRLAGIVELLDDTIDDRFGAGPDEHTDAWEPIPGSHRAAVSYGHELERVTLLATHHPTAGEERIRGLAASQVRRGEDPWRGGFFTSGPLGGPARDATKVWWVQAEALLSLLTVHLRCDDPLAGAAYLRTLGWVERRQVDHRVGEWHPVVSELGRAGGDKAGPWKTPYHVGRVLLGCLALLDADTAR